MSAPVQNNDAAAEQTYKEGNHNGHHLLPTTADAGPGGRVPKPYQSMVSQVYDPQFFKIANPGPLGLIAFALTTFVLGLYQCGAGLPNSNPLGSVGPDQAVFGLAVFYGGTAQFIAGIMEFRVGNTFGTTVHCSYGAFWLAFAMFMVPQLGIKQAYGGDEHAFSFAVGIFLILWCFLTLIFFIAALRTNIAILTVLGLLVLAFFFLSIAQFISTTHTTAAVRVNRAGGVFAVLCAFAAFYAGSAGLMTPATTWVVFPLGEFERPPAQTNPV
ncbi:Gpr1 family protein [Metarhizium anisopliae]|uniref:Gpr1 family protein n=2 Tax=Metarhizium TaxID=5529 RepID=A0A0D9PE13_METAN